MQKTAILIEKKYQIQALKRLLEERFLVHDYEIVTFRADVEAALENENIPFISASSYRDLDYQARMVFVEGVVGDVIGAPAQQFWHHRGISLGALNRISVQDYLVQFLYWYAIVSALLADRSYEKIIVFSQADIDESTKALSNRKLHLLREVVEMCTKEKSCETEVLVLDNKRNAAATSVLKQRVTLLFIMTINSLVRITQSPKKISLVVSDIWRNFEPYLQELHEAEVVLWERSEMFNIGWRNILKYRMRFMHADVFREQHNVSEAATAQAVISNAWKGRVKMSEKRFLWKERDITEHVMDTFGEVISRSYGDVLLIEDTFSMLKKIHPDAVLVRASASTQLHFPILCLVAAQLSIPSIEPQHGLFYLGPTSVPKHSTASKLATYGRLASQELRDFGYKGELFDVGSPRFDVYSTIEHVRSNHSTLTVLVVLPDDTTGLWFDTYDIVELLTVVKVLLEKKPQVKVILKARPNAPAAVFGIAKARKMLSHFSNFRIAITEPLGTLYKEVDVTVSVLSTIVLESFAAGVPVIYLANAAFHYSIVESHLTPYEREGGMKIVRSDEELCVALTLLMEQSVYTQSQAQLGDFIRRNFSFQSGSACRMADIIRKSKYNQR